MNKNIFIFLFAILVLSSLSFADNYTLRPNADGFTTSLTPVGCTNNYECVDEATADDDTTYVRTSGVQVYQYDLYDLPAHPGGSSDTINSIAIRYRTRCESSGGSVCRFRSYLRTQSTNYEGTEYLSSGDTYVNRVENYTTNPNTGVAWTTSDIDALQIGFGLNGFLDSDGNRARGTQIYLDVHYTPAAEPVITFVDPTPANDTYTNVNYTYINITTDIASDVATLEFNGTNYTMNSISNTSFYYNMTNLTDCYNYTYKVYANSSDSGLIGQSESRVLKTSFVDPVINWNTPSAGGLTFYDEFNISAEVLNCNLSEINLTVTDFDSNVLMFENINAGGNKTYLVFKETNFTLTEEPVEIISIEICARNEGGLSSCDTRSFIYDSNYSAPQHTSENIDEFIFSSSTYVTIINETFNQSIVNNATFYSSFYGEKLSSFGSTSDIYVKYILNGVELCDEVVVSLFGSLVYKSATTCISEGQTQIGENNIVIQVRRTSSGIIGLYNWNLHFQNGETNLASDFRRDVNISSGVITSSTFEPVINFTTEKRTNSTTVIDFSLTITTADPAEVQCYGTNGIETGQTLVRSTSLAGEIISMGGVFKTTIPQTDSETWVLYCKQDVSTSTIDIEAYTQDTLDDLNRTMNSQFQRNTSINSSTPLTLTAGKNKIGEILDYQLKAGNSIDIITSVIIESLTSTNIINVSIEAESNGKFYETSHLRTFSSANDEGAIKIYGSLDNVSMDELYNISVYVILDSGESANVLSESLYVSDTSDLDVNTSNLPPLVLIEFPEDGDTVWYDNQPVNFIALDVNGNLDTCNITLNDTVIKSGVTTDTTVDYTPYSYGDYLFNITCYDDLGLQGSDNIDVTLFCNNNWIPQYTTCGASSTRTLYYIDTNSCGNNVSLPADNNTVEDCTRITMQLDDKYTFTDLIIGKDYSYMGNLYLFNTTKSVSNALCTFISFINISDTNTIILDTQKYVNNGDGLVYYKANTNDWQKITDENLIDKTGYLQINCYCRDDCTDKSEAGCCILNNGTLVDDYLYNEKEVSFSIIGDESVFAFENIGLIIAIGIFALIMLYLSFEIEEKHFILKLFFLIMGMLSSYLITTININIVNSKSLTFLKMGGWSLTIFFIYLLIYTVYEILQWKKIIGGNQGGV